MGSSESDIKKVCTGAIVKKGLAINGSSVATCDSLIETWLKSNGLM